MSENLSSLLICVLVKSGKSLDDFYVVHPTSCSRQRQHFPLSQQIFKNGISLLTRNIFFSFLLFPADDNESAPLESVCASGKCFSLQWKFVLVLDFHENGLKMALEFVGVAKAATQLIGHQHNQRIFIIQLRLYQHLNV